MARNIIGSLPFTLYTIDTDNEILKTELESIFSRYPQVSLCVRSQSGPPDRGGYFFHFEINPNGNTVNLYDITHTNIDTLSLDTAVRFLNHASGRKYDEEMLRYCQSYVNFKQD